MIDFRELFLLAEVLLLGIKVILNPVDIGIRDCKYCLKKFVCSYISCIVFKDCWLVKTYVFVLGRNKFQKWKFCKKK